MCIGVVTRTHGAIACMTETQKEREREHISRLLLHYVSHTCEFLFYLFFVRRLRVPLIKLACRVIENERNIYFIIERVLHEGPLAHSLHAHWLTHSRTGHTSTYTLAFMLRATATVYIYSNCFEALFSLSRSLSRFAWVVSVECSTLATEHISICSLRIEIHVRLYVHRRHVYTSMWRRSTAFCWRSTMQPLNPT